MKAILLQQAGGAEQLYIGKQDDPSPAPGQVLVHIAATALNRADILQREGRYPPPAGASDVLGLEMAGTVIGLGEGVANFAVGDNVCALLSGGGYAQKIAVDEKMLLRLPSNLSFTKAAAIPEAFLTAFQALHWIAKMKATDKVLIHAGASGVGTAAIQLVRLMGASPIATASAAKHALLYDLGVEHCIDYQQQDFATVVAELTNGRGVDIVLDFVGAPYLVKNLSALALDGRMVSLGFLGGAKVPAFNMGTLLRKRIQLTGTTLRSREDTYKQALTADFRDKIWPHFATRKLRAIVDTIYDWEEVRAAHQYMESNANQGKIVLTIGD